MAELKVLNLILWPRATAVEDWRNIVARLAPNVFVSLRFIHTLLDSFSAVLLMSGVDSIAASVLAPKTLHRDQWVTIGSF